MFRRQSLAALAGSLMMTVALATTALAVSEHRTVQMLDACDGPSFNAVIGEGACERPGGVTFQTFTDQLIAMGTAPAWRFSPERLSIDAGGVIEAYNRGGEFHTFTEVAAFGGGCVPELNGLLGLSPVPECANPALFGTTGAAPGGEVTTEALAAGRHLFMCLIHPWMRTTVDAS
jgi:plastocyanin